MPFVTFRGDHLRSTSGIICGSGSFAVQFGDHFRSGDHLRSGIICGAVQIACACYLISCNIIWSVVSTNRDQSYALFNQLQALSNQLYAQVLISCLCHWISCNISLISWTHNFRSVVRVIRSVVHTIIDQLSRLFDQSYAQLLISCKYFTISCTHNYRSLVRVIWSVVTLSDQFAGLK